MGAQPRNDGFQAIEENTMGRMKKTLQNCRLYCIIDLGYVDKLNAVRIAQAMIRGGVDLIQLRGKKQTIDELIELAKRLHKLTLASAIPLIVNDYAEIAQRVPVEGVHVGQDDDSIAVVRGKANCPVLVGKSTHSLDQARAAQREGVDYIGFGPIFATPTKPDYTPIGLSDIQRVHEEVDLPIFCIGGIKLDNLKELIATGARRVVIVSGLLKAPDIAAYAREAKRLLLLDINDTIKNSQ
jgi:thiamine-phosphate pyrophosphorylase